MSTNKNTALQTQTNSGYMALANADLSAAMSEELDGLNLSFDKIKIPSAGAVVFEVPGEDGEPDAVKEFSAVILYHHTLNAHYKTKYTGGNHPPDCCSFDGVCGEGDPGGDCKSCPLNQFGTADEGAGKACKNRRRIYVLREGELFPLLLSLPTGSLKEFTQYLKRLLSKGKKSGSVVTRFSLKKATSSGGVVYSQAQFAVDRALTPQEQLLIDAMADQVKAYSRQVAVDTETREPIIDTETGEIIEPLGRATDV